MADFWKKITGFAGNIITNWAFTDKGIAVLTAVWGIVMGILTYFTKALSIFSPLSYGLAVALGLMIGLHLCRLFNKTFSEKYTNERTYVEYKIENRRINLVKKSNIYKEPSVTLVDNQIINAASVPSTPRQTHGPLSANILVNFEKPIKPSQFHVMLESIVGVSPTRENSSMDERWSSLVITNIQDNCSFRIRFDQ